MNIKLSASISGFKLEGSWREIVEYGNQLTALIRQYGPAYPPEDWNMWKPDRTDDMDDMREKTASVTSIDENRREKKDIPPTEELSIAKKEVEEQNGAVDKTSSAVGHVILASKTSARKAVREMEETVYTNLMTQIAPCYFDTELISANIQKNGLLVDKDTFSFEIRMNDSSVRDWLHETIQQHDDFTLTDDQLA
jgi:hypothetical protein